MSHLRLFIAFDTPPDIKAGVLDVQDHLRQARADVSWERSEKLHCTIKFLGDTQPGLVPSIDDALGKLAGSVPPFSVRYRATGCFPGRHNPRVVWIGIENPDGILEKLAAGIDEALADLGFKREDRQFHAHLTIGRVRSPKNVRNLLEAMETVTFESNLVQINTMQLIKSDLKPTGSVYTKIKFFTLVGNSG